MGLESKSTIFLNVLVLFCTSYSCLCASVDPLPPLSIGSVARANAILINDDDTVNLNNKTEAVVKNQIETVSLFSEGGSSKVIQNSSNFSSSTEYPTKVVTSSTHARKGVSLEPPKVKESNSTIASVDTNVNNTLQHITNKTESVTKYVTKYISTETISVISSTVSTTLKLTTTTKKPIPKKPTITIDFEEAVPGQSAISKHQPTISKDISIPQKTINSSDGSINPNKASTEIVPIVADYVKSKDSDASKDNDNSSFIKKYNNKISKSPNFIIPIIITIFAVPILGLIGYQVIRRGREAWRNRHYRRMDYLIEGMYND